MKLRVAKQFLRLLRCILCKRHFIFIFTLPWASCRVVPVYYAELLSHHLQLVLLAVNSPRRFWSDGNQCTWDLESSNSRRRRQKGARQSCCFDIILHTSCVGRAGLWAKTLKCFSFLLYNFPVGWKCTGNRVSIKKMKGKGKRNGKKKGHACGSEAVHTRFPLFPRLIFFRITKDTEETDGIRLAMPRSTSTTPPTLNRRLETW